MNHEAITRLQAIIIAVIVVVAVVGGVYGYWAMTRKPTREELVIGVTCPLSGPWSIGGKRYKEAYTALADKINEEGGVYVKEYGKKLRIKLIIYDDKSDPTTAASLYEKLITVDEVDALIGPGMSGLVHAAAGIAEKHHKVMTVIAGDEAIFERGFHYVFTVWPTTSYTHYGFVEWLSTLPEEERPKFIGILQEAGAYAEGQAKGCLAAAEKFGLKAEIIDVYPPEIKDFTPVLTKARDAGVDVIAHAGHMLGDIGIPKTCKEIGWKPKMIYTSVSITLPEFLALGEIVEDVMGLGMHHVLLKTPGNEEFVKIYEERYGRIPYNHDAAAWASMQVTVRAIELAGSLDSEKIKEKILTETFLTVVSTFRFNEDGRPPAEDQAAFVFQVQNGEPVCVWPREIAWAEPVYPLP